MARGLLESPSSEFGESGESGRVGSTGVVPYDSIAHMKRGQGAET
jgi:hypothetical protein